MRNLTAVFAVAALFFGGCARPAPSSDQLAHGTWGPLPMNYQDLIRGHIGSKLKDPYSAVFDFRQPVASWAQPLGRDYEYAWVVCGTVNGKNSFGGYVGAQPFYVAVRNGRIINSDFSSPDTYNFHAKIIEGRCEQHYAKALPVSPETGMMRDSSTPPSAAKIAATSPSAASQSNDLAGIGITVAQEQGGVRVMDVAQRAAGSSLQIGDILLAIDGKRVQTVPEIASVLATKKLGDTVTLTLDRAGQLLTAETTFSSP